MKNAEPSEPSSTPETLSETDDAWSSAADAARSGAPIPCPGPGARIAHYEVIRLLGQGGSADVVLVQDTRLDRRVALKLPRRRRSGVQRLLSEARILACLHHENIVMVHEVSLSSVRPYMAVEYVGGRTLRELLRDSAPSPADAVDLMTPLVRAVAFAHDAGFVHRDLKPENVKITETGKVKLLDFGLARRADALRAVHRHAHPAWTKRAPAGSLLYMAPEQLRSEDVDARADVWALGLLLMELIEGRHPFSPFAPGWLARLADASVEVACPPPRKDLCSEVVGILRRCLRKRPEERYRNAGELLAALEEARSARVCESTWSARVAASKTQIARSAYALHGTYSAAARALAVGRSTLRRHLVPSR